MKFSVLTYLLLICAVANAQQINDTTKTIKRSDTSRKVFAYFQFSSGMNIENSSNTPSLPYGIDIAQNSLKNGYYIFAGGSFVIKEKTDLSLQITFRTQTRDNDFFNEGFKNRYPSEEILHLEEMKKPYRLGVQLSYARIFNIKSILLAPKIGIGAFVVNQVEYEYVVRTPHTNYFDLYRASNNPKAEFPVSFGFNITHEKFKWILFTSEVGYSKNQNRYSVYHIKVDQSYKEPPIEELQVNHDRVYFSFGLILNLHIEE